MEPSGRSSYPSTIPSLIACVCSGLLIVGLLLLRACVQHEPAAPMDATTNSVAPSPTPEVPFEQQAQDILDTKDMKCITSFWRANTLRLEKAGLKDTFEQSMERIAREQALWALDVMESTVRNDPNDVALACDAWHVWRDAREPYFTDAGPLTEEEMTRLLYAFDVIVAHTLVTEARSIDTRTQRGSIAELIGDLGALRFSNMHGGFNHHLPRPNGIGVVKVLYDEGLLPRQDLLQILRIGVRDESLGTDCKEADRTNHDPIDRSLLALLQLEIPPRNDVLALVPGLTTKERLRDGAVGFRALADAFRLNEKELVALGVTEQEARFILHSEHIAEATASLRR